MVESVNGAGGIGAVLDSSAMNDSVDLTNELTSEFRTNCPRAMQTPLAIASAITHQTNGAILLEALGLWCQQHEDRRIQALLPPAVAKDLE